MTIVGDPTAAVTATGVEERAAVVEVTDQFHLGAATTTVSVGRPDETLHVGAVREHIQVKEIKATVGLQLDNGKFINYTSRLSGAEQAELQFLMDRLKGYDDPYAAYSINLDTLIDSGPEIKESRGAQGQGEVLIRGAHEVLGGRNHAVNADLKRLRELAKKAIGPNLHFTEYPVGYRTCLGKTPAFSTGQSERLGKKIKYDELKLAQRLEELHGSDEKKKVLNRYLAAKMLMARLDKLLTKDLVNPQENPHLNGLERASRLQRIEAAKKNAPHEAAVLFGVANLDRDPPELRDEAVKFIESFKHDRMSPDRAVGILKIFNDTSEENKKSEAEFANQIVLLKCISREDHEPTRRGLGAEERSDGPELFFVQLADAIANLDEEGIKDLTKRGTPTAPNAALEIALGHLHEDDKEKYRAAMEDEALALLRTFETTALPNGNDGMQLIKDYTSQVGPTLASDRQARADIRKAQKQAEQAQVQARRQAQAARRQAQMAQHQAALAQAQAGQGASSSSSSSSSSSGQFQAPQSGRAQLADASNFDAADDVDGVGSGTDVDSDDDEVKYERKYDSRREAPRQTNQPWYLAPQFLDDD